MGKNKRKKKQKEEDFKKVKLKVGKTRPGGGNETVTSFKSRGIVIPSQELSKDGQPTNVRKQSLKDLLSRVCHYSATVRQEALLGLRNLFQQHEQTLHENLGSVVGGIAEKMTDTDPAVRHSLLLLFRFILPLLPTEKIAPFLPLLTAHLSCGMTHIFDDVQLDSLEFLGLFLEYFPNQIIANSSQLLDNFIGLITHQSGGGSKQSNVAKMSPGSSNLIVNPKGKLSSQKSRLKILNQLHDFLKALYSPELRTYTQGIHLLHVSERNLPVVPFTEDDSTCCQVFQASVCESDIDVFTFEDKSPCIKMSKQEEKDKDINISFVKDFMQRIVPLLLECWVECSPAQMSTSLPDNVISPAGLSIMSTVMSILKVLLNALESKSKCVENEDQESSWLASKYLRDFNHHFMSFFPFMEAVSVKKKRKARSPKQLTDMSVMSLNIAVCQVMSFFLGRFQTGNKRFESWIEKLEEFVVDALDVKCGGNLSVEHVRNLLMFIERVLHDADSKEHRVSANRLLEALYKLYQSSHLMSAVKKTLLHFFAEMVLTSGTSSVRCQLAQYGSMKQWLCSLPKVLIQLKSSSPEMSHLVFRVLSRVVIQDPTAVDSGMLNKQLGQFFSPASGPFVHLSSEVQRPAIELLFSLVSMDDIVLQMLATCCNHISVPVSTVKYLLQVLHYRSPMFSGFFVKPPAFSLPCYLSLLLSIAIGKTHKDLCELQGGSQKKELFCYQLVKESVQSECGITADDDYSMLQTHSSMWDRHQQILQAICQMYTQAPNPDKLLHLMEPALGTILRDVKVLPVSVADSIIQLFHCLIGLTSDSTIEVCPQVGPVLPPLLLTNVAELTLSCAVYCTRNGSHTSRAEERMTWADNRAELKMFDDVLQLLAVFPPLVERVLCVLKDRLLDVRYQVALITTKLLESATPRLVLRQYSGCVNSLVEALLEAHSPDVLPDQCLADLEYQHSLFTIETNRNSHSETVMV